ncbi:MAG: type II secretion system protein [Planctomycetota bacterium]|jgi:prepilin-type N-terminal cleavage/methylation domain-containing protein|nr:type II secretion system protein [Planctomycetota bacterium]
MRRGFTLAEVLISLMILSVTATAMIGTLMAATRLFREGEVGRSANDTAMSVIGQLNQDLDSAIPSTQGGDFYADVVDESQSGDCVVGWTIANPDPRTADVNARLFVLWGRDTQGDLRRRVFTNMNGFNRSNVRSVLSNGALITDDCEFFGAWLAGTKHNDSGTIVIARVPVKDTWWQEVAENSSVNPGFPTQPQIGQPTAFDTRSGFTYPSAVRVVLLLDGGNRNAKRGIVTTKLDPDDTQIPVAGLQGLPTVPGSVLAIGDGQVRELVGYSSFAGNIVQVTQDPSRGPVEMSSGIGRGVYRSPALSHIRGTEVRSCRQFSLIKALPH